MSMNKLSEFFKNWIYIHYGIIIPEYHTEWKLAKLLQSLSLDEDAYIRALKNNEPSIVTTTLALFTIPESYFFRTPDFFSYLKQTVLPKLIAEKLKQGVRQLSIWSAGCARGEEIYSVAILLDQLLPDQQEWTIHLIGTDINQQVLEKGREGVFTRGSMRAIEQRIVQNYFTRVEHSYLLKKEIRDRVRLEYYNLANTKPVHQYCDLIFCRNVFIYLNRETIISALKQFYEHLQPSGLLMLGATDLITYFPHPFKINYETGFQVLSKHSPSISKHIDLKKPNLEKKISLPMKHHKEESPLITESSIYLDIEKNNYQEALKNIQLLISAQGESALILRYQAQAYLGLSNNTQAIQAIKKAIDYDPLDAVSYFIQAITEIDQKKPEAAINLLQKSLYLNTHFPEAAYYLGLLYLQNKQWQLGIKTLKQALKATEHHDKKAPVLCAKGTIEQLIQSICEKITYYEGQHDE